MLKESYTAYEYSITVRSSAHPPVSLAHVTSHGNERRGLEVQVVLAFTRDLRPPVNLIFAMRSLANSQPAIINMVMLASGGLGESRLDMGECGESRLTVRLRTPSKLQLTIQSIRSAL